jgi:hypothetical protein
MANLTAKTGENPRPADATSALMLINAQIRPDVPDAIVDANIALLRVLSGALSKSMSETQFNALLACAAHRADLDCPGWRPRLRSDGGDLEYGKLCRCLLACDAQRATALINRLWDGLIDQLSVLIGSHLTLLVLRRALREP